jgi:hypothetical protein
MAQNPQANPHHQVGPSNARPGAAASLRDRLDEKLDEALEATFPASDPFELIVDEGPDSRASDAFATVDEDPNSRASYASPPCFMHELDPAYLGLAPEPAGRADDGEVEPTEDAGSA